MDKKLKSLLLVIKCSRIVYVHSRNWQSKFAYVICYSKIRHSAIIFCDTSKSTWKSLTSFYLKFGKSGRIYNKIRLNAWKRECMKSMIRRIHEIRPEFRPDLKSGAPLVFTCSLIPVPPYTHVTRRESGLQNFFASRWICKANSLVGVIIIAVDKDKKTFEHCEQFFTQSNHITLTRTSPEEVCWITTSGQKIIGNQRNSYDNLT